MLAAVLSCFAASVLAPWVRRTFRGATGWILALLPLALTAYFSLHLPGVVAGDVVRDTRPWVPGLDVALSFRLDGLSLLFALLVTGIGALVVLYAGTYMEKYPAPGRFHALILAFMGSMLGLVLADDVIVLYVFWELTSVTSFLLIGFDHERAAARRAARQALLVTAFGGLALLAGLLLLSRVAGTLELSAMLAEGDAVKADPLFLPILLLVLLGAFTKSAQVPFHFWLPNAMEAPTPVSAYLHSATMVNAGIYLLLRLRPVLDGTVGWSWLIAGVGGATALWGALEALRQTDLKRLLAFTTVAALGQTVLLIGLEEPDSIKAAVVFLLAHSLYKGAFFLVIGSVDRQTGTREEPEVSGLGRLMPGTAAAAVLAGLSMAGLPPLLGFISKEAGYAANLGLEEAAILITLLGLVINALTFGAAAILVLRVFFGPRMATPRPPHDPPLAMEIGPVVLAVAGLLFGLFPTRIGAALVEPATTVVLGEPHPAELGLWPGIEPEVVLSLLTIVVGTLVYRKRAVLRALLARADPLAQWGPAAWYGAALSCILAVGRAQTRFLERRPLGYTLVLTFAAAALGIAVPLLGHGGLPAIGSPGPSALPREWVIAGLIIAAAAVAVFTRSRLAAIAALTIHGFGAALLLASFGALDLAITQFLVETLTIVIAALVLVQMPSFWRWRSAARAFRLRDAIIALAAGATLTALLLSTTRLPFDTTVPDFYAERSVPGAHGRNVVNTILVDFRALDTLGEIFVIAVAGIGVFSLLRLRPTPTAPGDGRPTESLILRTITRLLVMLLLLYSIFLLLRGHNEPGGGFIGALVAALAFALVALAYAPAPARRMLRIDARALIGAGLTLAILAAVAGMLHGLPVLSAEWRVLVLRGREIWLGTPILFDLGVYLAVLGSTVTMILALEEEE